MDDIEKINNAIKECRDKIDFDKILKEKYTYIGLQNSWNGLPMEESNKLLYAVIEAHSQFNRVLLGSVLLMLKADGFFD